MTHRTDTLPRRHALFFSALSAKASWDHRKVNKPNSSTVNNPFSPRTAKKSSPPRKKSSPPWQVLSPEQAKQNVEKELERRQKARQGIKNFSENTAPKVLSKSFLSETEQRFINWKRFNPMTAISGMRLVGSYLDKRLPPKLGVPEVAFLGRSNAGKSSLLNKLSAAAAKTTDVQARVGKTPGATASVNLYALMDAKGRALLAWTDLPGFGYAKLSKDVQDSVQSTAEHYLAKRKELVLGILLVDIRRDPSDDDRAVLAGLYDMGVSIVVVATKVDKVSENEQQQRLSKIRIGLGLPEGQPLTVSSVTGFGCRKLWGIILDACETSVREARAKYDLAIQAEVQEGDDLVTDQFRQFQENEDELVYSQGYDWIQDSAIMYEGEDPFSEHDEDIMTDSHRRAISGTDTIVEESLKSLKKRAKDMERKGLV